MTTEPSNQPLLSATNAVAEDRHLTVTRRQLVGFLLLALVSLAALYWLLPQIVGFGQMWERVNSGEPWCLVVAALMRTMAFVGYMSLFRAIFAEDGSRITWWVSCQVSLAGVMATRLLAAGGAGGVALTAWALRRAGMDGRHIAEGMVAFMAVMYGVYMFFLLMLGILIPTGVFGKPDPVAITVIPAVFGGLVIVVFLALASIPADFERRFAHWTRGGGRTARLVRRFAAAPAAVGAGMRCAVRQVKAGRLGLIGGFLWWAFDILTLWAAFKAFGEPPNLAILTMAYFVGMLANLLPVPGGIGSVDGGMIGALIAFGVNGGLALIAVLTYRLFAFWLPMIPGTIAYFQLRHTVHKWRAEDAELGAA